MSDILKYAIEEYKPVWTYALFSGGKDSLTSTHWAMEHGANEVLHINTGIGVNEHSGLSVEVYVRDTCCQYEWPLRIEKPPDLDYRAMVLKYGFPGPGAHRYPYVWLKERCVAAAVRAVKTKRMHRVGLVTGVHQSESARRMGYVCPVIKVKARIWIAPLFDWNAIQFADYRRHNNLEVSEIVKRIGMSGECFCGAFAKPDELSRIEHYFPHLARQIYLLQEEAKVAGVHCKWGERPPRKRDNRQDDIPFMPLCVNCHGQA